MVPILSELWRMAAYLLRPEGEGTLQYGKDGRTSALAGLAKALLWAGLSVLTGLGLAQLR